MINCLNRKPYKYEKYAVHDLREFKNGFKVDYVTYDLPVHIRIKEYIIRKLRNVWLLPDTIKRHHRMKRMFKYGIQLPHIKHFEPKSILDNIKSVTPLNLNDFMKW